MLAARQPRAITPEETALLAAIGQQIGVAVESRGGVQAELRVEGSERLPRAAQEELYHLAQEALNNALKHAHAQRVLVRLRFGDITTRIEIEDDGMGFNAALYALREGIVALES